MVRNARAVSQSHESLSSFRKVAASSNRKFGVTVGGILVVLALWPLVRHHHPRVALLVIGGVLLACGIVLPAVLAPVNKLWFRLGMLLASVTSLARAALWGLRSALAECREMVEVWGGEFPFGRGLASVECFLV